MALKIHVHCVRTCTLKAFICPARNELIHTWLSHRSGKSCAVKQDLPSCAEHHGGLGPYGKQSNCHGQQKTCIFGSRLRRQLSRKSQAKAGMTPWNLRKSMTKKKSNKRNCQDRLYAYIMRFFFVVALTSSSCGIAVMSSASSSLRTSGKKAS